MCARCKRDGRLLQEQALSSSKVKKPDSFKCFLVTLVLTGNISIVPGGPGKPSAPGRPGRPGGPYKKKKKIKFYSIILVTSIKAHVIIQKVPYLDRQALST